MAKVFFSYSHVDEALRNRVEVHLSLLKRQGLIEAWNDRRITAGSKIDDVISKNLEEADVILLLVSADFIASDYCYSREMKRALERHREGTARVIPVILQPCDWHHAEFGELLAAPRDGKPITTWAHPEEALADVARQVRDAVAELHAASNAAAPAVRVAAADSAPRPAEGAFPASRPQERPRSSNLRLTKEFSDFDRDNFLQEAFEFTARFFDSSLNELAERNPGIQGRFQRIDAQRFTAAVYRNGKIAAECSIRIGFGSSADCISFSYNASASSGSANEMLRVEQDLQAMYLKPMGMQSFAGTKDQHLSDEGAAEYLWGLFIETLQR